MLPERWEFGSEFHFAPALAAMEPAYSPPWDQHPHQLYACGRDALIEILRQGAQAQGWRRVWVPDYLCQEVVTAAGSVLGLASYSALPTEALKGPWDSGDLGSQDVVLVVNSFGAQARLALPTIRRFAVIEDHTHDPTSPWAEDSVADYALASLRKTVPVPDGGVLWSPRGLPLPEAPQPRQERLEAAERKLVAMVQKALYLDGADIEKAAFRANAVDGEAGLAEGAAAPISAVSAGIVSLHPWQRWRRARHENHQAFADALSGDGVVQLLQPRGPECVPFSCLLLLGSQELRDSLRSWLIAAGIYPAILWPIEATDVGASERAAEFSRRVLSVACDDRYSADDLARVAATVREWRSTLAPQGR